MNVRELINLLEEAADQVGSDEADIQLATQAHYPLRYHLAGVYVEEVDDPDPADDETGRIIWLVEGSQHYEQPYSVPEDAWNDAVRP
jgi:hypothetical protein